MIENGSNANGGYTKFADGTFLCRHTVNLTGLSVPAGIYVYSDILWTLPITATGGVFFKTIVSAALFDSNADILYVGFYFYNNEVVVYNTGATGLYYTPEQAISGIGNSVCSSAVIKLFAYGRWY